MHVGDGEKAPSGVMGELPNGVQKERSRSNGFTVMLWTGHAHKVGSRYALLKGPSRLSTEEQEILRDITRRNRETARAYQRHLAFDDFFKQKGPVASRGFLKGWITAALSAGIPEMETAATSIRHHWKMVVNWTKTHLSNGILEGFNSLLQAMKACARGYRTFEFIRTSGYVSGIKPIVNSHSK